MFKWIYLSVKKMGYKFIQLSGLDLIRNATALYPYGLAGNSPKNSLVLTLNIDGCIEKAVCIELSKPEERALQEGEFLIGNFLLNKTIKFDSEGNIIIDGNKIVITGDVEIQKTLKVTDSIDSGAEITNGNGVTLGGHTHEFPYNAGPTPATGITNPGQG